MGRVSGETRLRIPPALPGKAFHIRLRGGDVANEENLIPFDQRSKEEARELGRKGGIASGVSRRRKRSLREAADLYLSLPVSDQRRWNKIARKGIDPEDVDNQMAIIIGLSEAATAGDARAAKVILDLLGENLTTSAKDEKEDDPLTVALKEELKSGV